MVELPTDESRDLSEQFIFPQQDLWVPVAVVNRNVHILPGVPLLCEYRVPPSTEDHLPRTPLHLWGLLYPREKQG